MATAKQSGPPAAALARFRAKFEKTFGAGVMSIAAPRKREVVTSGSLLLDYALVTGGYVQGKITEVWGPESVGKTTLELIGAAHLLRKYPDKLIAWIDMERSMDLKYAEALGVDTTRLVHIEPGNAEDVADQAFICMEESDLFAGVTIDSIGGMVSKKAMEKDAGDAVMGDIAKIVTRMVQIGAVRASDNSQVLKIINQVRANLSYGADTQSGGGFALRHASTHKLNVKRTGNPPLTIGSGKTKENVGIEIAVKVQKNRVGPFGRIANIVLLNQDTEEYGPMGIDRASEAFELGNMLGIIARGGSKYTLPDGSSHMGQDAAKRHFRKNPDAIEQVRELALQHTAKDVVPVELEDDSADGGEEA